MTGHGGDRKWSKPPVVVSLTAGRGPVNHPALRTIWAPLDSLPTSSPRSPTSWTRCPTLAGCAATATVAPGSARCARCAPPPCWSARPLTAIACHAAGLDEHLRARVGRARGIACVSTLGRLLTRLDGDALDQAVGAWLAGQIAEPLPRRRAAPAPLRAIAMDGKALRGSRTPDPMYRASSRGPPPYPTP